jgi:hypothetical protein
MLTDREPLTAEECEAIAECCVCDPAGWVPRPENLPLAEGLRERGTFTRSMECGKAVYRPSEQFKHAAALAAAIGDPSPN